MSKKPLPPISEAAQKIKPGIYEHYKGHHYEVIGIGRHEATLEEYVIYKALYDTHDLWIRAVPIFLEKVVVNEKQILRFKFLHEK